MHINGQYFFDYHNTTRVVRVVEDTDNNYRCEIVRINGDSLSPKQFRTFAKGKIQNRPIRIFDRSMTQADLYNLKSSLEGSISYLNQ